MATQYANGKIVTDGLVLALDAADRNSYVSGSLIWNDVSGNGYTGSLINGPSFSSGSGGNIVFDGVDDYMANSNYTPFNTSAMTYEIVFRANSSPTNGALGGSDIVSTIPYFYLDYGGGNIRTYHHASSPQYFTVQALPVGSIHHFVCTRAGTTERNYVNSIESLGRTLSSTGGNNNGFGGIGRADVGVFVYFNCNIYTVRIYNKVLSSSEIQQNYNAQKSRFGLK